MYDLGSGDLRQLSHMSFSFNCSDEKTQAAFDKKMTFNYLTESLGAKGLSVAKVDLNDEQFDEYFLNGGSKFTLTEAGINHFQLTFEYANNGDSDIGDRVIELQTSWMLTHIPNKGNFDPEPVRVVSSSDKLAIKSCDRLYFGQSRSSDCTGHESRQWMLSLPT